MHNPSPVQINPDPRILTVLAIGTEDNVRAHILRQSILGIAEVQRVEQTHPRPQLPRYGALLPQPDYGVAATISNPIELSMTLGCRPIKAKAGGLL